MWRNSDPVTYCRYLIVWALRNNLINFFLQTQLLCATIYPNRSALNPNHSTSPSPVFALQFFNDEATDPVHRQSWCCALRCIGFYTCQLPFRYSQPHTNYSIILAGALNGMSTGFLWSVQAEKSWVIPWRKVSVMSWEPSELFSNSVPS